jgi:hypothetical protein
MASSSLHPMARRVYHAWSITVKFNPSNHLTNEQQKVIAVILLLLLTGLAVKTWRTAHPASRLAPNNSAAAQKP